VEKGRGHKKEGDKRKLAVGLRLSTQSEQGSPAYDEEDSVSRTSLEALQSQLN
jgi:hypothetical protein